MAGIVGIMGAVQVGIMTKQLSKLAKGGPIIGPSHDGGGVNIMIDGKPQYEAEGGEFMVNKRSFAANEGLVKLINASDGPISFTDMIGFADTASIPAAVTDINSTSDDRIIEAINSMEFRPVVSVTDITDVTSQVTDVKDLADFS